MNRYIKQLQETEPAKIQKLIEDPLYENDLKLEYYELIKSLYTNTLSEFISGNYLYKYKENTKIG